MAKKIQLGCEERIRCESIHTKLALGRVVERFFPLRKRLETVHHGTIVAVRGGGDEQQDDPRVERNDTIGTAASATLHLAAAAEVNDVRNSPTVVVPFAVGVEQVAEAAIARARSNCTGTHSLSSLFEGLEGEKVGR
jgi:hypothetical protein